MAVTGCGLNRRSVQGRGLVLSLGHGRDGLEPVVRAMLGPGSEPRFREVTGPGLHPDVWAGKGSGPQLGSVQRLDRDLILGRDRYWVEIEPDFMAESETKPW